MNEDIFYKIVDTLIQEEAANFKTRIEEEEDLDETMSIKNEVIDNIVDLGECFTIEEVVCVLDKGGMEDKIRERIEKLEEYFTMN